MKLASKLTPYGALFVVATSLALCSACVSEPEPLPETEGSSVGSIDRGEPGPSQPAYIVARLVRDDGRPLDGDRIFYRFRETPRAVPEELRNSGLDMMLDENHDEWLFQTERSELSNSIRVFLTDNIPFDERTSIVIDFLPSNWERTASMWGLRLPTMVDGTFEMEIRVANTAVDPERNGCVIPSEACVRDRDACTEPELFSDCQHTAVDLAWPSTTVSFTIDDMRAIEAVTAINPDPVRGGYPTEMTLPVILLTLDGEQKLSAELIAETMPVQHPEYRYQPIYCSGLMYEQRVPWDELPWECREYVEQGLIETEEEYRERTYDPYGDRDFAPGED